VNVYAWAEYFPPSVIEKFQKETGIHVNYSVFDSPDAAETTLSAGSSNYDIVTMNASPHLAREIPKGFWKKLDYAKIPNARNADRGILHILQQVDPGNQYAVPWMWGTVGVMYNVDKAKAILGDTAITSLDVVLNKSSAARFEKCGISILDSWQDIMPMVSRYLGQPQLSDDPAKLNAVVAKLAEIKPLLRRISSSGYYEQLADGELCLAIGYSGDAMIARRMAGEGNTKVRIDYAYAREKVPLFVDSIVIPADSPNPDGALQFINFMMRPEISAEVTRFIGFASGNAAAVPLLEPALRDNTVVYPPAPIRERFEIERVYTSDELRAFNRAWQRFKTGQ
jgi:putrescine transport system substrate-binding protein